MKKIADNREAHEEPSSPAQKQVPELSELPNPAEFPEPQESPKSKSPPNPLEPSESEQSSRGWMVDSDLHLGSAGAFEGTESFREDDEDESDLIREGD